MNNKIEEIIEEMRGLCTCHGVLSEKGLVDSTCQWCNVEDNVRDALNSLLDEVSKEEIKYWKNIFDSRPKNRDIESDNIAQNFARIEIERWENRIKKLRSK